MLALETLFVECDEKRLGMMKWYKVEKASDFSESVKISFWFELLLKETQILLSVCRKLHNLLKIHICCF